MKKSTKVLLCVIGIFLVTSILIGISYAYYIFSVSQESANAVRSDCFEITYSDGNAINLTNTIPLTDKEAKELDPYTFTIKNICNQVVDYNVNIETLEGSTIDLDAVAIKLDGRQKHLLGSFDDNENVINNNAISSKTIYSHILKAGEEKTHNLRLWVDIDSTVAQSENKLFISKVTISGLLHSNYSETDLISGPEIGSKIRLLTGAVDTDYKSKDEDVTSIVISNNAPSVEDNAVEISTDNSSKKVYMWFNNGKLYIYSEADKIYLNSDSSYMFNGLSNIISLNLTNFDTSKVTNMQAMFQDLHNLVSLDLGNDFDTLNVTSMRSMFAQDKKLVSLDLGDMFDTSNVTDMYAMFSSLNSCRSLNFGDKFDTSKVTDMTFMLLGLNGFSVGNNIDLGDKFNTSNVTSMSGMFSFYHGDYLDFGDKFDTSKVTTMYNMFYGCWQLEKIDISTFDSTSLVNTEHMFEGITNLKTIYVSDKFITDNILGSSNMFYGNTSLVGGSGTRYDANHVNKEYARIDDPQNGKPGYFTLKTS